MVRLWQIIITLLNTPIIILLLSSQLRKLNRGMTVLSILLWKNKKQNRFSMEDRVKNPSLIPSFLHLETRIIWEWGGPRGPGDKANSTLQYGSARTWL